MLGYWGRIGYNLNQIAKHLNAGGQQINIISELKDALAAIPDIRNAIFAALGMKLPSPPATLKPRSKPKTGPPGHDNQGR